MTPDRILVEDLTIDCILGDLPHERERAQRVRVDLVLECDARRAAARDVLADAVDYVRAADITTAVAVEGRFRLVETLAERAAAALLALPGVTAVTVRVRKAHPTPAIGVAGVEIRRARGNL